MPAFRTAFITLLRASLPGALALAAALAACPSPGDRPGTVVAKLWMIDARTTDTTPGHGGVGRRNPITGGGARARSC